MKFSTAFLPAAAVLVASVASVPIRRGVDPNLVPQFGVTAGASPDGAGNCLGINNIKIPCACPPNRDTFIADLNANVAAGHAVHNPSIAVSFPTDGSSQSAVARIQASLVTLQNLNGPGQGCPASATTFSAQLAAAQAGKAAPPPPAPAAPAPAPAAAEAAPAAAGNSVAALAPSLGFKSGVNPTGTGDCDGAVKGANGQPIKIPCACPPAQDVYIAALEANVAAGHAVHNPSISVAFPTDNSKASQAARIQAALVTLQNLNGPGQGCPASSSTLVSQLSAVQ